MIGIGLGMVGGSSLVWFLWRVTCEWDWFREGWGLELAGVYQSTLLFDRRNDRRDFILTAEMTA